jgi:crotonobetainyl-CoA:carnitine CoA-transferase CaiB-like acyl-CoA transferase
MAAFRLAQYGADVTKVEPPSGDALARGCPEWYDALHAEQTVVTLDLKEQRGRDELEILLKDADLFLSSLREGALKRLALDWPAIHARHPDLSVVQVQGYPPPHEDLPAHDLTCEAHAGILSPPAIPRALVADFGAAERAFSEAVLLLLARKQGGPGIFRRVTIAEAAETFAVGWKYGITQPDGALGGGLPTYGVYRASSGWIALAAIEPHFVERLSEKLGIEQLDSETLERAFLSRSAEEWERFGHEHDIPIARLKDA